MAAESDSCCTCCFSFITTMSLTALFIWLSLRVDQPKLYLEKIYVPALNKSLTPPPLGVSFNFTVKLKNPNKDKGIKYDAVTIAFSLFTNSSSSRPLANATIDPFYQGHQKTAHKPSSASAFPGAGNLTAAKVDGKVYFRVDFKTMVRYKILFWHTKRYPMWGGANVELNDMGVKVYDKPVRLGDSPPRIVSGAPGIRGGYRALLLSLVVAVLVIR